MELSLSISKNRNKPKEEGDEIKYNFILRKLMQRFGARLL